MENSKIAIQEQMAAGGESALRRYQDLIVGRRGAGALLLYELGAVVAGWPGAAGLWLRKMIYPSLLGGCGRGVVFGRNCVLRHPHKIFIGDGVVIDENCLLDAKGDDNHGITLGRGVFVGRNSILSCKNGDIELGERVNIGFNAEIVSASRVQVGAGSMLAAYSYLVGADHVHADPELPLLEQQRCSRGIEAGENCWIGAGVIVNDGRRIGAHAIIGAGAVVTSDIADYAVAAGVPARVLRDRRNEPAAGNANE